MTQPVETLHSPLPDNELSASGSLEPTREFTVLSMPNGRTVRLPTVLLVEETQFPVAGSPHPDTKALDDGGRVIPLIEEALSIGKRVVETGKVMLHKTVQEYREMLDEPLAIRTFDVERVILNHPIETAPDIRRDGETTVYPVVEEQLVLTKQLILKEEIRVTRRDTERRDNQVVTLKREHIVVERIATVEGD